jgi:hypothetical protein
MAVVIAISDNGSRNLVGGRLRARMQQCELREGVAQASSLRKHVPQRPSTIRRMLAYPA